MYLNLLLFLSSIILINGESDAADNIAYKHHRHQQHQHQFHLPINVNGKVDIFHELNPLYSHWEKIPINEALYYFTSYELCLWYRSDTECKDHFPHINEAGNNNECNTNNYCHPSSLLMKHKSTKPWPEGKTLLDIITLMKRHNANTLFLIGDSVSSQMQDDAFCNLRRYNIEVTRKVISFSEFPLKSFVAIDINKQDKGLPYFRIILISDSYGYGSSEFDQINIGSFDIIQHYLSHGPVTNATNLFVFSTGLHFTFNYEETKLDEYEENIKRYEQLMTHLVNNVMRNLLLQGHVVLFRETSAQHFKTKSGMFKSKTNLNLQLLEEVYFNQEKSRLSWIQLLGYRSGVLSSEDFFSRNPTLELSNTSTTTHIPGRVLDSLLLHHLEDIENIEDIEKYLSKHNTDVFLNQKKYILYEPNTVPSVDYYGCKAIESLDYLYEQNYLNRIAIEKIQDSNLSIGIVYFHNITAARWDLHVSDYGVYGDCTHFCNTPLLWQPAWNQIYYLYEKLALNVSL